MRHAAPILVFLLATAPVRADDAPKQKTEHKATQSKSFVDIAPLYTTILEGDRASGMMMVRLGLDVPNAALHAEIDRAMPVLRDAYVRDLMRFTANYVRTDAQPDVVLITDHLQTITDRALKRKGAQVLLGQVAIRVTAK